MRIWLAIVLFILAIAAPASALPPSQQIIMFGGQSAASNPPPVSTCSSGSLMNGVFDLTNTCNDIYFIGGLK